MSFGSLGAQVKSYGHLKLVQKWAEEALPPQRERQEQLSQTSLLGPRAANGLQKLSKQPVQDPLKTSRPVACPTH